MTYRQLPILGLIATALVSAGFVSSLSGAPGDPVRINGGRFEASGIAHVPSTHGFLFVDDGRTREVWWMELNADGSQKSGATQVPLEADVEDLEGITHDGTHFYVVGSQSKKTGSEGDGLVRFVFNAPAKKVEGVERIQGLKTWLAANVLELKGTETKKGDTALNIEGIAWDPKRGRLLLGLRAPVVDGAALIVPISFKDRSGAFRVENLVVESGRAIRLPLNGAGIRSIDYDEASAAFRIITGPGRDSETRTFRIVEWDGAGGAVREVTSYPGRLKPEGITRAVIAGQPRTMIVFDTGEFALVD